MKSASSPYSPALDGLRAFAVISVVAYHLGLTWLPGGFLGVDLFFVISGFLITSLLVREGESTGRIRVRAFWARRARRLLPALVLMVAVVCATALLIGRELDVGLRTQVLGAAVFGSNWLQVASGSSYVDHFEPSLFTHLWSLAVEEQFYFFWPFVVVLLLSFVERRRTRVILICGLAAVSAAWMTWNFIPGSDPTRVYVGTDTHGFALLMGAALGLALGIRRRPVRDDGRRAQPERGSWWAPVGMVGFAVVLSAMLVLTDTGAGTFRGGIVVADLGGVALVGAAASAAGPVGGFFALRLFTWIGRRSYGIYLWHWPVIVVALRVLPRGTRGLGDGADRGGDHHAGCRGVLASARAADP